MELEKEINKKLNPKNWYEDHLNFKHKEYYTWCPLCMAKQEGEKNKIKNNDIGINVNDNIEPKAVFG